MLSGLPRPLLACFLVLSLIPPAAIGLQPGATATKPKPAKKKEDTQQRDKSLRSLTRHLGIGPGCVIADIGAGNGRDTWTFAKIVGETGKVYAEEIEESKTKTIAKEAAKRGVKHVEAILGGTADPSLPEESVDLAFMHYVYHHVAQPREMLQGIWQALKPGGHLVIVDQRLGTLADWVPRQERAGKHYWIAETTVVREAREHGFRFVECAERRWHVKDAFVLVFQRPEGWKAAVGDPEAPGPIPAAAAQLLVSPSPKPRHVAFVALGEGRKLIGPLLAGTDGSAVDIVLEEWATQKDERPESPAGVSLPRVLTDKGDPGLDSQPLDAVYFLDTYHLLFHGSTLLAKLRERLTPAGQVWVLDRRAPEVIPHRQASHRRMIAPETVQEEMTAAGFVLLREGPPPTDDRFLLLFGPAGQEEAPPREGSQN